MNWITWINTGVGVIGIIVGIIGWRSLSSAKKIKNNVKANNVQQAQIIHNGLDDYAVIRLSRDTTKEELDRLVASLPFVTNTQLEQLKTKVDGMPSFFVGKDEPTNAREGDIWFKTKD